MTVGKPLTGLPECEGLAGFERLGHLGPEHRADRGLDRKAGDRASGRQRPGSVGFQNSRRDLERGFLRTGGLDGKGEGWPGE